MTSIRALAQQHIGRHVVVHSRYGVHYGLLHHVDNNGMYLQLHQGRHISADASTGVNGQVLTELGSNKLDAENVFWPFFFIPFAAAYALYPWWGGYYW